MAHDPDSAGARAASFDAALRPLDARYRPLADALIAGWASEPAVVRIALGGSLGAGRADAYSDLDFSIALSDEAACEDMVAGLPAAVAAVYSAVLRPGRVRVFTAVTADWLRVDVVAEPIDVAAGRPRAPEVVVLDRAGDVAFQAGPVLGAPPDLRSVAESFLRILGLLPVSVGRQEGYVGMKGVMLLRDHIVDLFAIENGGAAVSGVKRLNPTLTAAQQALLEGQPALVASPLSVIESCIAAAEAFLPRARALATARASDWPTEFESATLAHLRATMGIELSGGSGTIQP